MDNLELSRVLCEAVDTARPKRMDGTTRARANRAMEKAGLDGNGRFASVSLALGRAWEVLSDFGLEPALYESLLEGAAFAP